MVDGTTFPLAVDTHLENTGAGSNNLITFEFWACGDFISSEFTLRNAMKENMLEVLLGFIPNLGLFPLFPSLRLFPLFKRPWLDEQG